jgi:hypothetical protein
LAEFQSGTDPRAAQHFFQLGLRVRTDGSPAAVLDFYALPGRSYLLERNEVLDAPAWQPVLLLSNVPGPGPVYHTNGLGAAGFYRLRVVPGP